jgi:hypothetical protein
MTQRDYSGTLALRFWRVAVRTTVATPRELHASFRRVVRSISNFVAQNPNFSIFALGFLLFVAALARYSPILAGVCGGGILMTVAVYPIVRLSRKP